MLEGFTFYQLLESNKIKNLSILAKHKKVARNERPVARQGSTDSANVDHLKNKCNSQGQQIKRTLPAAAVTT
jgi:hypothetical protein